MKIIKQLLLFIVIFQLANPAFAVDYSSYSLLKDGKLSVAPGAEYVSGAQPGSVLMKVNIWGGVAKPGIHHVPARTNIVSLLSYAGGPSSLALLDEVYIKRETADSRQKIAINLEDLITSASSYNVVLEPNDIVVVPIDEPWISNNTVVLVGVIATLVSIVALGTIIADRSSD